MPVSRTQWTLPSNPTLPMHSATKQYVDAVSIGWAGNVSGTWAPDWTLARQIKAAITAALTLASPSTVNGTPPDGYVLSLWLWTASGSQVVTIDGGLAVMAGFPTSFQLPNGKVAAVGMRYSTDFARWTVFSIQQEQ